MKKRNGALTLVLFFSVILMIACPQPAQPADTEPQKSANAELSGLAVSAGVLEPPFSPSVTNYSVVVPNAADSITVTGTRADEKATLSANNGQAQSLSFGANPIIITVTSESGAVKNYTVTVRRPPFDLAMVRVPAGKFQRDATAANISEVSSFAISAYEITRNQFLAIMGTDPSDTAKSSGMNDPVQKVNWYRAIAFCNKLSLMVGLTPVYSVSGITDWEALSFDSIPTVSDSNWNNASADWEADGYRLPTELEWMWAAMGAPADGQGAGTNTTGYLKAFAGSTGSNAIGDYAVFGRYSGELGSTPYARTNEIGGKLANEIGLYDMSGNCEEWCWDRGGSNYPDGLLLDYRGHTQTTDKRVLRGGSWSNAAFLCTVEKRNINNDGFGLFYSTGFRVVRK